MHWSKYNEDISFDEFGDIDILTGDIATISSKEEILVQNVMDRIKSSQGDYRLFPLIGSGIVKKIGSIASISLENEIENRIRQSLTYDGFLTSQEVKVACLIEGDTAVIGIQLVVPQLSKDVHIPVFFNLTTGVVFR